VIKQTKASMAGLPPLPAGKSRNPNVAAATTLPVTSGRPSSSRNSQRGGSSQSRNRDGGAADADAVDTASRRSDTGSRRSELAGVPPAESIGRQSSARASSGRAGASTAGRSITSSVALSKLQQLEDMLLEERRAREQAELTLLRMQKDKLERDSKLDKGAQAQKQLSDIMGALQKVLAEPNDTGSITKLRSIVRGAPVRSVGGRPNDSTSASKPAAANSQRDETGSEARSSAGAEEKPRSFLDNIGSYDRERQKNVGKRGGRPLL
jgi:hypothetical protein